MKAQWSKFRPDLRRHLLVLAGACLSGVALAWWWWPLDTEALDVLRQEVAQLQAQTQVQVPDQPHKQQRPAADAAAGDEQLVWDEPALAEAEMVWPWLQQRMQAQGLQVLLLRPQAVNMDKGLPEQAVALRLQGRWRDWLVLEEALHEHVPWWVIDQWQVMPAAAQSEDVRIELQARLGLQPPGWRREERQRVWPLWPQTSVSPQTTGAPLFASAQTPAPLVSASEAAGGLSADPRGWPMDQLRLLGVWRQAGTAHAVVAVGQDPVVLRLGQQIGREAFRVRRIGDDHVDLATARTSGPLLHLTLREGK